VTAAVAAGMRALLARRAAELEAGAEAIGWKIGFNARAVQESFGLEGPVVGYLTDSTARAPGDVIVLKGWHQPALEVEVAIRVGADGGVAALAPALELVDLDLPAGGLEGILAANVFHRGVVFGPETAGADVGDLAVSVVRAGIGDDRGPPLATGRLSEDPETTVEVVRAFLAAHGATLAPGDRIIAGSLIAPLAIAPGDALEVAFGVLGALPARFS
jgi:2-oxo-hept-3-ene-1,7-dioate hydratase